MSVRIDHAPARFTCAGCEAPCTDGGLFELVALAEGYRYPSSDQAGQRERDPAWFHLCDACAAELPVAALYDALYRDEAPALALGPVGPLLARRSLCAFAN